MLTADAGKVPEAPPGLTIFRDPTFALGGETDMKIWWLVWGVALGCAACGSGAGTPAVIDASPAATTAMNVRASDGGAADRNMTSDGPGTDLPDAAPTWSAIYSQLLVNASSPSNCMGSGCHDPGVEKGIDLSTLSKGYSTILRRVTPGMPATSDLIVVLQSGYMPLGRPHMPASDIEQISAWIQSGAQDN